MGLGVGSRLSQECNRCKEAGFPGQMIQFQQNGTKPDGSKRWKLLVSSGNEHVHKTKVVTSEITPSKPKTPQSDIERMHEENMRANEQLVASICRLAAAVETLRFRQ